MKKSTYPPRRVVPVSQDRKRREADALRVAEAQVREQGHPLFENLGSRNVPRKRPGR